MGSVRTGIIQHRPSRPNYSRLDWFPPHCAVCGRPTHYNGIRWVHDEDDEQ